MITDFTFPYHPPSFATGCRFGDKTQWCADYIANSPNECYRDNSTCCASCREHRSDVQGKEISEICSTEYFLQYKIIACSMWHFLLHFFLFCLQNKGVSMGTS